MQPKRPGRPLPPPLPDWFPRGTALLRDPTLNKGTAFTEQERDALGLRGLLPPYICAMEDQVARVLKNFRRLQTPLSKYILLESLHDRNEALIVRVITDKLVFDNNQAIPAYHYTDRDVEDSAIGVVNGVSKLYGMTGFRIGWVVANQKLVEAMVNVQAQSTSCISIVLQSAAEGALTGMQNVVENLRLTIQNNRNVIMQELKSFNGIHAYRPDGTFYVLPDFRAYNKDSVELARFLLKKALVVTVPGKEFGMDGHLRLSFAGSVKDITTAVERIKWVLDPNPPNEIYIGDRKLIRDWL